MNSEPKETGYKFDPSDVVNTPQGAMVEVPGPDGSISLVPLTELDPGLMGMGWDGNPDLEFDGFVTPEGDYRGAGPSST